MCQHEHEHINYLYIIKHDVFGFNIPLNESLICLQALNIINVRHVLLVISPTERPEINAALSSCQTAEEQ